MKGATAILRILFNNSSVENRTAQICALRGMTSSDILTRENSLEVLKLSSPADDNVAAKLQKKSAEILSDKDQLKQVSFSSHYFVFVKLSFLGFEQDPTKKDFK